MVTIKQTKLSKLPKRSRSVKKPSFQLNWKRSRPELKKFILLNLIRVIDDYRSPYAKITSERLIRDMSENMGGIVEAQVKIYIENLIYQGYISESYLSDVITFTDKVYDDLRAIDKVIFRKEPPKTTRFRRRRR